MSALVNSYAFAGYSKPGILTTGSGAGTVTSNANGYVLASFADGAFAYLNAGKTSGKWYWEGVSENYILFGITDNPTTPHSYGGYGGANAGVYQFGDQTWNQYGSRPAWSGTGNVTGDIYGFALDVTGKTLEIFLNGVLGVTLPLTSIGSPVYPLFGFQGAPSSQINLGPAGCVRSPPSGYSYI
jgi:hypothetical protein